MRQICLWFFVTLIFVYCIGCDAVTSSGPLGDSIPENHWLGEIGGAWILTFEDQTDHQMVIHLHVEKSTPHVGAVGWNGDKFEIKADPEPLELQLSALDDCVFLNWRNVESRSTTWQWLLLKRELNGNRTKLVLYPPRTRYFVELVEQGQIEGTVHHRITAPMQPGEPGVASLGNDGWTEVHITSGMDQLAEVIRAGDEAEMFVFDRPLSTVDQIIADHEN